MQRPLRQRICRCEVHIGAAQGLQLIMDALCLAHMLRCLPQERSRRVPRKVQRASVSSVTFFSSVIAVSRFTTLVIISLTAYTA